MAKKEKNKELFDIIDGISLNRVDLFTMRDRLKLIDGKMEAIFPESKDYSKRYLLENKIKTIVEFQKVRLDVNRAIEGSFKSEFEVRRKVMGDEKEGDEVDIREVVKIIEELDRNKTKTTTMIGKEDNG